MSTRSVIIPVAAANLYGELTVLPKSESMVLFVHGSGSSRKSARNRRVAEQLNQKNISTLLFDLLTEEEDKDYANRFNIKLLTSRLIDVTTWLSSQLELSGVNIGYFGASTGAASALEAAARLPQIMAIVSRGGRPDLAMEVLNQIHVPVLLIVGSQDEDVLELNRLAYARLSCEKKLKIIEGATHLFEEAGALDKVADEATIWFKKYLTVPKKHIYV